MVLLQLHHPQVKGGVPCPCKEHRRSSSRGSVAASAEPARDVAAPVGGVWAVRQEGQERHGERLGTAAAAHISCEHHQQQLQVQVQLGSSTCTISTTDCSVTRRCASGPLVSTACLLVCGGWLGHNPWGTQLGGGSMQQRGLLAACLHATTHTLACLRNPHCNYNQHPLQLAAHTYVLDD